MEVTGGSCRFNLWFVHVWWVGTEIHRVRFATTGIDGPVPSLIRQYCAGKPIDLSVLGSPALDHGGVYGSIYRAVREIPYGKTVTYKEIAAKTRTAPRVVGQAMAHNPTPLVIPCHRVVGTTGIGGFSPSVEIKEALLRMEKRGLRREREKEYLTLKRSNRTDTADP